MVMKGAVAPGPADCQLTTGYVMVDLSSLTIRNSGFKEKDGKKSGGT